MGKLRRTYAYRQDICVQVDGQEMCIRVETFAYGQVMCVQVIIGICVRVWHLSVYGQDICIRAGEVCTGMYGRDIRV